MTAKIIIVDSDALIALFNKDDSNAEKTEKFFEILYKQKVRLIYPATTLVETIDTLRRKLKKHKEAGKITKLITDAKFAIESIELVDGEVLKEAAILLGSQITARATLADAVVAAIARKYKAAAIFSFDSWYKKLGFKLVGDLMSAEKYED